MMKLEYASSSLGAARRIDGIGVGASLLCAIQCALLPTAASLLPAIGSSILAAPLFEAGLIALGASLAVLSLSTGYRRHHHRPWAIAIACCGFASIAVGQTIESDLEQAFTASGAFAVAVAHVVNARLCRRCCAPGPERSTLQIVGAGVSEES